MKLAVRKDFPIFVFFFGSGFAALVYQIVWLKYLSLLFGNTIYATAAVLSAFMFGLSAGSWLSAKISYPFRSPLRTYGIVEMAIGLFAIVFPVIYSGLKLPFGFLFNWAGPDTFSYNLITFLIAFVVLAVPTSLMGASLPLLSHYLIHDELIATKTGYLYGVNTAGAVAGVIIAGFILIPALGLHATIFVGVLINLAVGLFCFLAGKEKSFAPEVPVHRTRNAATNILPLLYTISGLAAIGYEVIWTRLLVLHLGSSVYAYAIMLAVFLIGISTGSYLSGLFIAGKNFSAYMLFALFQTAWAFSIVVQAYQFSHLSDVLYRLATLFGSLTSTTQFLVLFLGALQLIFVPTLLSGALFPVVVTSLWREGLSVKDAVSLSYSYNTVGGIFGSIIAAFLLIPLLGTQKALLAFASLNFLLGMISVVRVQSPSWIRAVFLGLLLVFCSGVLAIQMNIRILESAGIFQMEGNEKLVHLEEDASATISVETRTQYTEVFQSLSVNGVNVAGTSSDLVSIQKLQGHIPMMLFGPNKPKRVCHIGFGSGGTAYAVSLYPHTEITVVELSRAIVRNADTYFRPVNHGIVESQKVKFVYFDGRSFLQNTHDSFDVILSDSIHPRYAGNGSLYTKDYYQLVWSRLNPGGVHSQWIPLYSLTTKNLLEILRAFHDVFPETYVWYINSTVNPYIVVTARKQATGIPAPSIAEAFQIKQIKEDLESIHVPDEYFLLDYFLMGRRGMDQLLRNVNPHDDDRMTVEYESSRVLDRQGSWLLNFQQLLRFREDVRPYLANGAAIDSKIYERFLMATRYNLEGQLYLLAKRPAKAAYFFKQAQLANHSDTDPYVPGFNF